MASVVGICNSALIKLGASPILSLTEGSKSANLCNEQYEKVRDDLLRAHPWNFAAARQKLARLAEAPAFGFAFAYQLPADFLRAIEVADGIGYKIEGRKILSDAADIYLRYVRQVTDPNEMDALFREALAWRLAVDLAIPITQSNSTLELMRQGYGAAVGKARAVDAIEDWPEEMPDGSWIAERV